ncbi:expressed unknown protein [Ectocarpus siliculosus]|uniref:Uncharacterized protein n=1 Tax=Ectocarpus siliculosus TaxID=2880 RepID=D7FSX5_ECTSI|nr:expressed unknown protein [Ectocarpus siliculosus]|eukprot:CBJ31266.1 expressed unknown protein [Ectocarpus siliculosus]
MEPTDVPGATGGREEDAFGFPSRRQGSSKPSHRRTVSSPVVHDFLRDSIYSSSGPFGALGDSSNGLFSPRLAVGSKGHHRESASGDYLTVSTEAGDTSYGSSMDSLFHRGGLESLRSDFLKMDLGKRRISEDERERVSSHHSNATDSVDGGGGGGSGGGGVSSISRSLSATGDVRVTVSSSDSALHLLAGGGVVASGVSSSGRGRPPSAGPSMDSSAGSSVGVSSVLGGPGGGTGGTGGSGGGGGGGGGFRAQRRRGRRGEPRRHGHVGEGCAAADVRSSHVERRGREECQRRCRRRRGRGGGRGRAGSWRARARS